MKGLLKGALDAGAFGMSSSRTALHVTRSGRMTPDYNVEFRELRALAETLGAHDSVFEFAPAGVTGDDVDSLRRDMAYYEQLATETGARVHLLMQQIPEAPDFWQEQLAGPEAMASAGETPVAQRL
jgi:N-acyl-D-aspartate/D-glutamate deacylase